MGCFNRDYGRSVRPVISGDFEEPEQPEQPEVFLENETITVNGVSFTMIAVEGGTFKMGAQCTDSSGDNYDSDADDDESPVHSVTLSSYYIGETEVTQELWEAVMGSNPSYYSGSQRPVEKISWNDCQEFITKLNQLTGKNFRLPTEAEWEYAARGGNKSQGYKYSGSNTIDNVAWCHSNSSSQTHDVKTKQANELGIYDMSGNVYECCHDWYGSYGSSSQTNPTGPTSGSRRVLRDGSWNDGAGACRVSSRFYYSPDGRYNNVGLRLSLSQD
ncbi:MAG: formylglycine-generating enzyme family protein [Bacteroidales bacterium]|nr:formylglycine-generating enzyme family protein [Bacteroidales bacterium]